MGKHERLPLMNEVCSSAEALCIEPLQRNKSVF